MQLEWFSRVIRCAVLLVLFSAFLPSVALAEAGDWMVRARLIYIAPNDDASGTLSTLAAEVESDLTVEVDVTRFITNKFAIEAILATAAQEITNDPGTGRESLGSVYHAPATVLAQYHFNSKNRFVPYLGAGLNYTIFYSESGGLADLDLDSGSFGLAAQAGFDVKIGEDKVFNFDLKHINIESDVSSGMTDLGTVEVNPLVVGVGFGVRF